MTKKTLTIIAAVLAALILITFGPSIWRSIKNRNWAGPEAASVHTTDRIANSNLVATITTIVETKLAAPKTVPPADTNNPPVVAPPAPPAPPAPVDDTSTNLAGVFGRGNTINIETFEYNVYPGGAKVNVQKDPAPAPAPVLPPPPLRIAPPKQSKKKANNLPPSWNVPCITYTIPGDYNLNDEFKFQLSPGEVVQFVLTDPQHLLPHIDSDNVESLIGSVQDTFESVKSKRYLGTNRKGPWYLYYRATDRKGTIKGEIVRPEDDPHF